MKLRFSYDKVLKDLFERDRPSLLGYLTGDVPIKAFLNVELPKMIDRRIDCVAQLANGKLAHIEFQSQNHRKMPYRQGIYGLLLADKYGRLVEQSVIYTGSAPMRMRDSIDAGCVQARYRLIDIREFDALGLAASAKPADRAMAILGGGGAEHLKKIVAAAAELEGPARDRAFAQLAIIAGLRGLSERVTMELTSMSITIDISKNAFLQGILEQGKVEGKLEGLVEGKVEGKLETLRTLLDLKFGRLPAWANQRLIKSTPAQLDLWLRKVLTADTIEAVIGRRS